MTRDGFLSLMRRWNVGSRDIALHVGLPNGRRVAQRIRRGWFQSYRPALHALINERRWEHWRGARRDRARKILGHYQGWQDVERIAAMLDRENEPDLADWLLMAKPEALPKVAAGVACHSLNMGFCEVWDAIVEAGISDFEYQDGLWWGMWDKPAIYFTWEPGAEDLIIPGREAITEENADARSTR
jgi:hypothetical protein